jgi:hypothetical protein
MFSVGILMRWSLPDLSRASIWHLLQISRFTLIGPLLHRAANLAAVEEITVYSHDKPLCTQGHRNKDQVSPHESSGGYKR